MEKTQRIQSCDALRAIPLETVLLNEGAKQDTHDRKKWHTAQGPLSIAAPKFFNWQCNYGGGGAIDLVMHLKNCDFSTAIAWLSTVTPYQQYHENRSNHYSENQYLPTDNQLMLPAKNNALLPRVSSYLIKERKLPPKIIHQAIDSGTIYADAKGNAVFLMRGKSGSVVGAELRGTAWKKWRGVARGSDKQKGAFYTGSSSCKTLSLCESAIDALSYITLYPNTLAISTAGATAHIVWIDNFIKNGFRIICAFDNDDTGNRMADKIIHLHPMITRNRPKAHDWNEVLRDKGK